MNEEIVRVILPSNGGTEYHYIEENKKDNAFVLETKFNYETERISAEKTSLETQQITHRVSTLEQQSGINALIPTIQEMKNELNSAQNSVGQSRELHLLNAEKHAVNAWRILNGRDKYKSQALNMIFTILRNNNLIDSDSDKIRIIFDLAHCIINDELDAIKIDENTMRSYTKIFIKNSMKLAAF